MELLEQYRLMHAQRQFPGTSLRPWLTEITGLVNKTGAQNLLDYGCGLGEQYTVEKWHSAWGILPTLYDPAVKGRDVRPKGTFHGVICTDVLEHVPDAEVGGVCADLCHYAERFLFVTVCCRAAKRILPDGRNAHITIKPAKWWDAQLKAYLKPDCRLVLRETP